MSAFALLVRCLSPMLGQSPTADWYGYDGRGRLRPHRLAAWDTALSRRRHGFESRWGHASVTVDGMRSCRAAWSARHPVKVEVAGSNPVGTAGIPGEASLGSHPGQVAQLV